jgi:hypothetical protein
MMAARRPQMEVCSAAIEAHTSSGSEANQVIAAFHKVTPQQQQDLLNFLRSL